MPKSSEPSRAKTSHVKKRSKNGSLKHCDQRSSRSTGQKISSWLQTELSRLYQAALNSQFVLGVVALRVYDLVDQDTAETLEAILVEQTGPGNSHTNEFRVRFWSCLPPVNKIRRFEDERILLLQQVKQIFMQAACFSALDNKGEFVALFWPSRQPSEQTNVDRR